MDFTNLVQVIADVHQQTHAHAVKAVNTALTLRNWLIGAYINEYELQGQDRAVYGGKLIGQLSKALCARGIPTCEQARLYSYLLVYRAYPQIRDAVSPEMLSSGFELTALPIFRTVSGKSPEPIVPTVSEQSSKQIFRSLSGKLLLARLSYSHLELLAAIDDSLKRAFYEVECIKGNWSVRELKRQIASLYFERSALSRDPVKLAELANEAAVQADPRQVIRDPYVFEFLGLKPSEVLPESDLEAALIEKVQAFMLELGHGFCFEARQKRLVIGGEYFFVNLVFYHRVLKCHVLVELKVSAFSHEHIGQLNTYVTYYRAHEMSAGDQPPIGILLCTDKNHALAEYALAGMDNCLFVSKYQLELPKTEVLQRYLVEQRQALEDGKP
ncbi:hypothetical protein AGMMS50256_19700 [Betaproteobacteria bacterium]|nr:hypothetical protein AGMMS50256_19700 [Betaproteobacteria bacterium]